MSKRERVMAQEESASSTRRHLAKGKAGPLLTRYLGTALQATLTRKPASRSPEKTTTSPPRHAGGRPSASRTGTR